MVGDYVAIEFSSQDASSAISLTLKDANDATRVLAANERLLIDELLVNAGSAAGLVTIFNDTNGDGAVNTGERIAEFQDCVTPFHGGFEGYGCPIGITPKVKAATAGQVSVNGSGRIVIGQSQGQYPSWQASRITSGV